ncbi:MAG: hypothetical protein HOV76_29330 [Hamadaea sp.]|nr:hypothetical protein [Hamadaea sp.]
MTTKITDPMSMAVAALDAMDEHAARVREVAVRLLSEHAAGLPKLIGIRVFAGCSGPRVDLQPRTNEAAAQWAQALGVTLTESFAGDRDGWRQWHMSGSIDVDGVRVHVGAMEWVPSVAADAREVAA